ncbi:unnamed protein product, partial [Cuscuta epithymum]|jgi:hypothetical protein
MKLS